MEEDIQNGLHPFFVSTTLGTTGCCAFDNLQEIGKESSVRFLQSNRRKFVHFANFLSTISVTNFKYFEDECEFFQSFKLLDTQGMFFQIPTSTFY